LLVDQDPALPATPLLALLDSTWAAAAGHQRVNETCQSAFLSILVMLAGGSGSCSSTSQPVLPQITRQPSTTSSTSASSIVAVCQFKASYQLSEITDIIRGKMVVAIANMLEVNASIVVLEFSSDVVRRRDLLQQAGVLVSVGLTNFYGSVSVFATRITQENMNAKMAAEGLKAVQLMAVPSAGTSNVLAWLPPAVISVQVKLNEWNLKNGGRFKINDFS
jgi:hypothetical protein